MIGTEIGSYRILEKLGEGGMGVVYKAVDTSLDRVVAVKVLSPDLARNPELVQRFRAEARAQANLNHTNLATLYAFLVQDGMASMVMEFVDGETFEQMILRRGPIPADEAVPLFKQSLLGIGYAHRAGIVHRDIKPSNLMVNRYGIVKVMDFGIAKVMGTRGMTRTGTQMGTGWYMSPEQVLNKPVDIRSDIYSLGVTLYQMLTAHVPFEADSDFQIMSDHVHTPPPPPTKFYPYVPKGLESAVLKALGKNPDARFQTVEEFGFALERPIEFAYAAPPIQASPPPPPTPISTQAFTAPMFPSPIQAQAPAPAFSAPVTPAPAPVVAPKPGRPLFATAQSKIIAGGVGLLLVLAAVFVAIASKDKPAAYLPPASSSPAPRSNNPPAIVQQFSSPSAPSELRTISPTQPQTQPPPETQQSPPSSTPPAPRPVVQKQPLPRTEKPPSTSASPEPSEPAPSASSVPTPPPVVRVRPEIAFDAVPRQIRQGDAATLRWYLTNADSATIEPGFGTVHQATGQIRLTPAQTTSYTLTATSKDGTIASATTTVEVIAAPAAPAQPTAMINVYHDHGTGAFNAQGALPSCWGQLQIIGNRLHYKTVGTNDGRRDDFDIALGQMQEAAGNRMPIRNQQAFHITVSGQHFNFIPVGMAAIQAVNLLQSAARQRQ